MRPRRSGARSCPWAVNGCGGGRRRRLRRRRGRLLRRRGDPEGVTAGRRNRGRRADGGGDAGRAACRSTAPDGRPGRRWSWPTEPPPSPRPQAHPTPERPAGGAGAAADWTPCPGRPPARPGCSARRRLRPRPGRRPSPPPVAAPASPDRIRVTPGSAPTRPEQRDLGQERGHPGRPPEGSQRDAHEGPHQRRVEVRPGPGDELLPGRRRRHRDLVGPGGGHHLVGVGDGQDPRPERDVLAGEPVGIAGAVPLLVVVADGVGPGAEPGHQRFDEVCALLRVALERRPLLVVGTVGLVEDRAGHGQLADAAEQCPPAELVPLHVGEPGFLRQQIGQRAHPFRVPPGPPVMGAQGRPPEPAPPPRPPRRCGRDRSRPTDRAPCAGPAGWRPAGR